MGPLGFLTGVVLGSAASIALVLAMVLVIFVLAPAAGPALGAEFPALLSAVGLFGLLAAAAGAALIGLQRQRPWRWAAQGAMWLALALLVMYYWPRR